LEEKIKEDKASKKMDRGQLNKRKKDTNRCFGETHGKEVRIGWRSLENPDQVDLGF
jgi:hypothetical protein